jgi:flagellar hook-associated protein 1 FlgK
MSINGLLNIAGQSLANNQIAINVVGANIANVNTPGYSRQNVSVAASSSVAVPGGADFGVSVDSIKRAYDHYLEAQIVEQAKNLGYDTARQEILGRVDPVFNETGSNGLNDLLSQFWTSWETLASDPASSTARAGVVSAGKNLASLFRQKGEALETAKQDVKQSIGDTVANINASSDEIASLNGQIRGMNVDSGDANSVIDRRMELIKELGNNVNISYYENSDHTVDVLLSNGQMLVGGATSHALAASDGNVTLKEDKDVPPKSLNSLITGGRLGGMIEMSDTTLKGYADNLNLLANGIVSAVNSQHHLGFDASGAAGGDFFDSNPPDARNMKVNAAILADPQKLAASSTAAGQDGENARQLGALRDSLTMSGAQTFNDYYAALVGRYAYDVNVTQSSVSRTTAAANQLATQRETSVGVSLDEEIVNLMKYQFGYNAAGKLAKTASDMLDVLMTIVR